MSVFAAPDQGGAVGYEIGDADHRFLVRDRDVDADEAHLRQGCA
jgi:hypothetical protein